MFRRSLSLLSAALIAGSTLAVLAPNATSQTTDQRQQRSSVTQRLDSFVATPRGLARVKTTNSRKQRPDSVLRAKRAVRSVAHVPGRVRADGKTAFVAHGRLKIDAPARRAALVLREYHQGRLVTQRRAVVRSAANGWTTVSARLHPGTGSRIAVKVVVPKPRPGATVPIRDLSLTTTPTRHRRPPRSPVAVTPVVPEAAAPSVEPKPTPAPKPTPESKPETEAPGADECTFSTRGIPSCGSYVGAAHGSNTEPTALENTLGRQLGVRRTYYRADQVASAVRTARTDLAAGRLPWISFKLPHSWEQMTAGQGDAWARDLAGKFATVDGPVWLAFHHEPETDGNILAWRSMQERLAPLVRGAGSNIAFTVVLTGWHQFYGEQQYRLDNMWPRGVKVDVAGFDIYNQYGVVKNGKTNLKPSTMKKDYYEPISAWANRAGVAWGIAETGYTDAAAKVTPNWIKTAHEESEALGAVAFAYFDTSLNSIANWQLNSAVKVAAMRSALVDSPALPTS